MSDDIDTEPNLPVLQGALSLEGVDERGRLIVLTLGEVKQTFRFVPAGTFTMGSPESEEGRFNDEGPQHEVTVTHGYWMADTQVTQQLWSAVMGKNPSRFKGNDRPVEQVSWKDCQAFIVRLNGIVPGINARLPTEAEWEKACRAGTTTATWAGDLKLTSSGKAKVLDGVAVYYDNSPDGTRPVRSMAANPLGLYDMLGNVYEWCQDCYGGYEAGSIADPTGPTKGSARVVRGGAWRGGAGCVRAAYRGALDPGIRDGGVGFRLARAC